MVDDEATNKQDNEGTYAKYLVPHVVISFVRLVWLRFLCFYYVIISHCERRRSYVCVFVSLGARALPQREKYLSKQAGSLNLGEGPIKIQHFIIARALLKGYVKIGAWD